MSADFVLFMAAPLAACLAIVCIHAWLGLHILARGVIFVDLALAQLAALGAAVTLVAGFDPDGPAGYAASLAAAFLGAALFSFTRTRSSDVPQEAIIGVVYVVAAAASIIALDRSAHGAEHLKEVLVGQILWVSWTDVGRALGVYAVVGALHWLWRRPFLRVSNGAVGMSVAAVRAWDFLFYATFGIVITVSVPLAGVLLVFSFLIVPALCAVLIASTFRARLLLAWAVGFVVSAMGCVLSYTLDLPTGAAVVCTFGGALGLLGVARALRSGRFLRWLPVVVSLSCLPNELSAQSTGHVVGTVIDALSAHPLPGVNVSIADGNLGTTTDIHGHFHLASVPAGEHSISFSLIGYDLLRRHLHVVNGEETRVDAELSASPIHLGEMLIRAERTFSAASSRAVREFDLQVRPRVSAQQMPQMAPGLIIAQHAGGGKAEQIFLRNFDADHGTDVAVTVDGMPVNMVSHGHGQGYADLHFLIPELVEELDVDKGPYFAAHGNLATAGAVSFQTKSHLNENLLRIEAGSFGTAQYTALYQLPLADPDNTAYFAGNYYRTDGPVEDAQGLQRLNVFAKIHTHLSARSTLTLDAGGFSSAWDASGQIPQRAVDNGHDRAGRRPSPARHRQSLLLPSCLGFIAGAVDAGGRPALGQHRRSPMEESGPGAPAGSG